MSRRIGLATSTPAVGAPRVEIAARVATCAHARLADRADELRGSLHEPAIIASELAREELAHQLGRSNALRARALAKSARCRLGQANGDRSGLRARHVLRV